MKKLGIFGGTFNPIHKGHIEMINGFAGGLSLDKVILIPTFIPPHKSCEGIIPFECRYEMCRIAAQKNPAIELNDIEKKRGGASYTYDTLSFLQKEYPDYKLYLLTGADMFLIFDTWYKYKEILQSVVLCTIARGAQNKRLLADFSKNLAPFGQTVICDFNVTDISSTQIRDMVKKGLPIDDFVDKNVESYIKEKNLYR